MADTGTATLSITPDLSAMAEQPRALADGCEKDCACRCGQSMCACHYRPKEDA